MVNKIDSTAIIYNQVNIVDSSVGCCSTIGDNTDLIRADVGDFCSIDRRNLILDSLIQEGSCIGANSVVKSVRTGRYCDISWNVSLGGDAHNYNAACMYADYQWRKVFGLDFPVEEKFDGLPGCTIGNDVWIASGVNVISGVNVGDGAVIGAGAVVVRDVPSYAVVVGVPAKVVKYRFSEDYINRLLDIAWWDWDRDKIKLASRFLHSNLDESALSNLEELAKLQ